MSAGARLLFYAIDGTGLGHLSRLLAIARVTRELLHAMGLRAEIAFLTTSEAPEVAFDFPSYKLPSRGSLGDFDVAEWSGQARYFVASVVASLRPDLLVVDTVPEGAFAEVAFVRSSARASVFVDRHRDARVASSDVQQRHLALYDRILVPALADEADRHPIPHAVLHRRRFVGAVHGYRPELARPGLEVRERLGVPARGRLIYLSGGGGVSDREGLDRLALALAEEPSNRVLIGYGPLHRGPVLRRENIIPLTEPEVWRLFPGLDAAVSAAGYNSYQELLAAHVPCLFFAQRRGMDRQDERVAHGVRQGWHLELVPGVAFPELATLGAELVRERVNAVCAPECRAAIQAKLAARTGHDGALRAAEELLSLHADLPRSALSREAVAEAALLFASRGTLAQPGAPSRGVDFTSAARAWFSWRAASSATDAADDRHVAAAERAASEQDVERLSWGAELERLRARAGWSPEDWRALWRGWLQYESAPEPVIRRRVRGVLGTLEAVAAGEDFEALLLTVARVASRREQLGLLERVAHVAAADPGVILSVLERLGPRRERLGALELDDLIGAALDPPETGASDANQG